MPSQQCSPNAYAYAGARQITQSSQLAPQAAHRTPRPPWLGSGAAEKVAAGALNKRNIRIAMQRVTMYTHNVNVQDACQQVQDTTTHATAQQTTTFTL